MVLSGALVAGIRAGYAYNTWPLMNGSFIPPEILLLEPWYANIAYNMATVQFIHRTLAIVIALMAIGLWFDVRREPPNRRARWWSNVLLAAVAAADRDRHLHAAAAGAGGPRRAAPGGRAGGVLMRDHVQAHAQAPAAISDVSRRCVRDVTQFTISALRVPDNSRHARSRPRNHPAVPSTPYALRRFLLAARRLWRVHSAAGNRAGPRARRPRAR